MSESIRATQGIHHAGLRPVCPQEVQVAGGAVALSAADGDHRGIVFVPVDKGLRLRVGVAAVTFGGRCGGRCRDARGEPVRHA